MSQSASVIQPRGQLLGGNRPDVPASYKRRAFIVRHGTLRRFLPPLSLSKLAFFYRGGVVAFRHILALLTTAYMLGQMPMEKVALTCEQFIYSSASINPLPRFQVFIFFAFD